MKRVELDGDELILRLFENGEYQDIKFVRDQCKPKESNCYEQNNDGRHFGIR